MTLEIKKRDYKTQRINGLPPKMVTPPKAVLQRIRRENRGITAVRRLDSPAAWYASGFIWPARGRISGVYGSQRILNGKPRTKISTKTTPGTNWDEKWHRVRIIRQPADGTIQVYFDDMKTPIMTASDKTFASGRVGLGSFDDTTDWRNFKLQGVR